MSEDENSRWATVRLEDLPLREELWGRSAYGAPQLDVPIRLNTNENSHPLPDTVIDAVAKELHSAIRDLNRYPDRDALALRQDLAGYLGHGLTSANVWVANGSNEIQQQLLQAFGGPGRTALGFVPTYSMYPLLASATATRWISYPRGQDFTLTVEDAVTQVRRYQPSLVFLCSPNNPTGTALSEDVIRAVADISRGIVVVDEAYAEFAREGTSSALALLPEYPRLVVSRTMSKAFAFAGARVGYLAACPAMVEAMTLVRLPYHLSSLTQAAARAALSRASDLLATVGEIKRQRDRIVTTVRDLGLTVADSDANFVLFRVPGGQDQEAIWQALLDQGVLVRDVGLTGWLRVTAGTEEETDAFLAALTAIVSEGRDDESNSDY